MYFSNKCSIFYIFLLLSAFILIFVTIIEGIAVTKAPWFLICEFFVNLMITVDYGFRMKLAGVHKFFKTREGKLRLWNWFDSFVVVTCNLMYIIIAIMPKSFAETIFDGLE